jgi:hypothetical protein
LIRQSLGVPFGIPTPKCLLELGAILIRSQTEMVPKIDGLSHGSW